MQVFRYEPSAYFGSCMYLMECDGVYAVIDPSLPPEILLEEDPHISLSYIILTHAHFDHMLYLREFKDAFPSAKVLVGYDDAPALTLPWQNASTLFLGRALSYDGERREIFDGEHIILGNTSISFYDAKGHTKGSMVICAQDALFVGDLIFDGGAYGRYDLPGGDAEELFSSIRALFKRFDGRYTVYPGHGAPFSLDGARESFKYLLRKDD